MSGGQDGLVAVWDTRYQVNNRVKEDVDVSPLVMLPGQCGEVTGVM